MDGVGHVSTRVVRYVDGEEADLSASTVADDDELPANFRHGGRVEEGRRG